jgi:3-deoxy-D-manno-octulosonic-acid transferase
MKRAFKRLNPAAVFIAETDFWPAFSLQCKTLQIPLFLINGRISDKLAAFYKKARGLGEIVFSAFSLLLVQSAADLEKLVSVGVPPQKILVSGNIKADLTLINNDVDLSKIISWVRGRKLFVFGSLHPLEFNLFKKKIFELVKKNIAVLIAPRNLNNSKPWFAELKKHGLKSIFKSMLPDDEQSDVLLLDTMGELAAVYSIADCVFVGGSIDPKVGGHNPLEVIQQNVPLLMGTNNRNFADIIEQLQILNAVYLSDNPGLILQKAIECLNNKTLALEMIAGAKEVLENNKGAMDRTIKEVTVIVDEALNRSRKK